MKAEVKPVALSFTVFGSPIAQPRQRHKVVREQFAMNYTPSNHPVRQWKYNVSMTALEAISKQASSLPRPLDAGPLRVDIDIFFPRPQKFKARKYSAGPIRHVCKPDRDNIEKAILDALKGIVFVDDCQVCAGEVKKFYHELNGRPRAEIRIEEL